MMLKMPNCWTSELGVNRMSFLDLTIEILEVFLEKFKFFLNLMIRFHQMREGL